jgi:hypothetical protein
MLPITVVTPKVMFQPSSSLVFEVLVWPSKGPAPCAADNAQIVMHTSVMPDMTVIHSMICFIPSGLTYMMGAIMMLNTTHPTNCFVSRFALAGKWFLMCWKLGKIAAKTF